MSNELDAIRERLISTAKEVGYLLAEEDVEDYKKAEAELAAASKAHDLFWRGRVDAAVLRGVEYAGGTASLGAITEIADAILKREAQT